MVTNLRYAIYPSLMLIGLSCLVLYTIMNLTADMKHWYVQNQEPVKPTVASSDVSTLKAAYELVIAQVNTNALSSLDMDAMMQKRYVDLLAYISIANPSLAPKEIEDMSAAIIKSAKKYDLPVGLIASVVNAESTFVEGAIGPETHSGRAHGAMQVMWPLHKELAHSIGLRKADILTADGGVDMGCYLLKRYIQNKGSILGGLAHYFSAPSKTYVLEKVITGYLAFVQAEHSLISPDMVPAMQNVEVSVLKGLLSQKR